MTRKRDRDGRFAPSGVTPPTAATPRQPHTGATSGPPSTGRGNTYERFQRLVSDDGPLTIDQARTQATVLGDARLEGRMSRDEHREQVTKLAERAGVDVLTLFGG